MTFATLALIVAVVGGGRMIDKRFRLCRRFFPPLTAIADYSFRRFNTLGLQAKLKVVVAYYQICADIETTYSVQLPEYFTAFMNIFSLLRIDWWYSLFLPQGCLGSFTDRLFLTTLSPVGLLGLVLAFLMFHEWYSRAVHRVIDGSTACDRVRSAFSNGLLATIPVALLATFAIVPSVSARIFQAWNCE
eukprot:5564287-Prymnesium_polylepis.1